jgi:hypothetical protein
LHVSAISGTKISRLKTTDEYLDSPIRERSGR